MLPVLLRNTGDNHGDNRILNVNPKFFLNVARKLGRRFVVGFHVLYQRLGKATLGFIGMWFDSSENRQT